MKPDGETENSLKDILSGRIFPIEGVSKNKQIFENGAFKGLNDYISSNSSVNNDDVLNVKKVLVKAGHYEPNSRAGESVSNLSGYPDETFFNAIKSFQKDKGLLVDGVMKKGGETESALMNSFMEPSEKEKARLKKAGIYNKVRFMTEPVANKDNSQENKSSITQAQETNSQNKDVNKTLSKENSIDADKLTINDFGKKGEKCININTFQNTFPNKASAEAQRQGIVYREVNPDAGKNTAIYMANEMNKNSKEVQTETYKQNSSFYSDVNDNKKWDHKPQIKNEITNGLNVEIKKPRDGNPNIQPPVNYRSKDGTLHNVTTIKGDDKNVYDHDIWSNVHYGYVGRANESSKTFLKVGSFVEDLVKNRSFELKDLEAVNLGSKLWDKYGSKGIDITPEILNEESIKNKDKLSTYPR
ncbi:MAG: polymorphic toxin type 44 domain-containing protein [Alphaproteobacteria bacterium]